MRTRVIAWTVGLVVLAGAGWAAGQAAADATTLTGTLSASEQEADEGYFALGQDTMLAVKPGSAVHAWLRGRAGQQVRITIEVERGTR